MIDLNIFHYPQGYFSVVDIYNYSSNTWTTASLSQARSDLSATTVENLAMFAGGINNNGVNYINEFYFLSYFSLFLQ